MTVRSTTAFEIVATARTREGADEVCLIDVRVPPDMFYFQGHFEGRPILPAVVQLNCLVLVQACEAWADLGALHRVTKLKFRRPVGPGEALQLRLQRTGQTPRVVFTLTRSGETVALGSLDFDRGSS